MSHIRNEKQRDKSSSKKLCFQIFSYFLAFFLFILVFGLALKKHGVTINAFFLLFFLMVQAFQTPFEDAVNRRFTLASKTCHLIYLKAKHFLKGFSKNEKKTTFIYVRSRKNWTTAKNNSLFHVF